MLSDELVGFEANACEAQRGEWEGGTERGKEGGEEGRGREGRRGERGKEGEREGSLVGKECVFLALLYPRKDYPGAL